MSHPVISRGHGLRREAPLSSRGILSQLSLHLTNHEKLPFQALCTSTLLRGRYIAARKTTCRCCALFSRFSKYFAIRMQTEDPSMRLIASDITLYHPYYRDQSPTSATPFAGFLNITRIHGQSHTSSLLLCQASTRTSDVIKL